MKCPYLVKWVTDSCRAREEYYQPTPFQREEYCRKKAHTKCPFFLTNRTAEKTEETIAIGV
jgi:hypothetical protein